MSDLNKTFLSADEFAFESQAAVSSAEPQQATTSVWVLYGYLTEGGLPQQVRVQGQPFTIGREPGNTLCVSNGTVSGSHAELLTAGSELLLRDLNSTNGSLLNGRRIHGVEVLKDGDILHFGNVMFTVRSEMPRTANATVASDAAGDAIAQVQFDKLISRPGIEPHFQPIVDLSTGKFTGFEVLSRSHFIGLETPAKMFRVAAQRTSEAALSRVCRLEGMRVSTRLDRNMLYYLNTHPAELDTPELIPSIRDLRERHPNARIMLEVHESAVTSIGYLKELRAALNDLHVGLAYDDFGSGQARLTELIAVPPDVLKFDVKLVRGLTTVSDAARNTIGGLIRIVKELNVIPLAEGIETVDESAICQELGFELAQGFLFGKGEPATTWLTPASP